MISCLEGGTGWTDTAGYELDWQRDELVALRHRPYRGWAPAEVERLLAEAFHTGVPAAEFYQFMVIEMHLDEQWLGRSWVDGLLVHLTEIRRYRPPRPTGRCGERALVRWCRPAHHSRALRCRHHHPVDRWLSRARLRSRRIWRPRSTCAADASSGWW